MLVYIIYEILRRPVHCGSYFVPERHCAIFVLFYLKIRYFLLAQHCTVTVGAFAHNSLIYSSTILHNILYWYSAILRRISYWYSTVLSKKIPRHMLLGASYPFRKRPKLLFCYYPSWMYFMPSFLFISDPCAMDIYFVALFWQVNRTYILIFRNNFNNEKSVSFFFIYVII
jgi:hypothetical protein